MNNLDHLVYCVPNLENAIAYFEDNYGMSAVTGGRHEKEGTKNAILNLGNQCYLELLSIDESLEPRDESRWMGIDLLTSPKITRWALGTEHLVKDSEVLREYDSSLVKLKEGSRKKSNGELLKWQMSIPGSTPEVELMPFLIHWFDWENHPTSDLPVVGKLIELELMHPNPSELKPYFDRFDIKFEIKRNEKVCIQAILEGPRGRFKI